MSHNENIQSLISGLEAACSPDGFKLPPMRSVHFDPVAAAYGSLIDRLGVLSLTDSIPPSSPAIDPQSQPSSSSSSSTPESPDYRVLYADVLRALLTSLCSNLESDSETLLSTENTSTIVRAVEILFVMSVLPSFEPGTVADIKKRTQLVQAWDTFTDQNLRREQLGLSLGIFQRIFPLNDQVKTQLTVKLLPDYIAGIEHLSHFHANPSESLITSLPRSVVASALLSLNGTFGGTKAPLWFTGVINTRLSNLLVEPQGLFALFMAFTDLGGKDFWQNHLALSAVAKLLATKPRAAPSYQKYASNVFAQFLDAMKNKKAVADVSLLFGLTVDRFYAKAPFVVEVQLVDRLIRPWELLVQRGVQNTRLPTYGFWSPALDSSILVMSSWLQHRPQVSDFSTDYSFAHRFDAFVPLWLHLCGLASHFDDLNPMSEALAAIVAKVVGTKRCKTSNALLKFLLADADDSPAAYIGIRPIESSGIVDVTTEGAHTYPAFLDILEEPYSTDDIIDAKIDGFKKVIKALNASDVNTIVVTIMVDCLASWLDGKENSTESYTSSFVSELDNHLPSSSRLGSVYALGGIVDAFTSVCDFQLENLDPQLSLRLLRPVELILSNAGKRVDSLSGVDVVVGSDEAEQREIEAKTVDLAVGLLGSVVAFATDDPEIRTALASLGEVMDKFVTSMQHAPPDAAEPYASAAQSCTELLSLFWGDLKLTSRQNRKTENPRLPQKPASKSSDKQEQWQELLDDSQEALRGGALIQMAAALRNRDPSVVRDEEMLEWMWQRAFDHIKDTDSYVFLSSVNLLAELGYLRPEAYLDRLVNEFVSHTTADSSSTDREVAFYGKIAAAIAKVFVALGDFSTVYFDTFVNGLLNATRAHDEILRSSALSALASLAEACRGRKFTSMLSELLFMVSQLIKTDDSPLVRRSAAFFLRSLLTAASNDALKLYAPVLRDIFRSLKQLWQNDKDEAVRLHAELALIDLKKIIDSQFNG